MWVRLRSDERMVERLPEQVNEAFRMSVRLHDADL